MVLLDNYKSKIDEFILESVQIFTNQYGNPKSIGIYCCPWSGWMTINFNLKKSLQEANNNCPNFEFVEFAILDFPEWEDEYETNDPKYQRGNTVFEFNHKDGDEKLNEIFLPYLLSIVAEIKTKIKQVIVVQFLDRNYFNVL